jgi:diketogulonate reductase-like aldo/keto reductase
MQTVNGIPILGFGTWPLKGDDCVAAVTTALAVGYRHIDTADGYQNHHAVGQAIRASGIPRDALFLTSKVRRDDLHHDAVIAAGKRFATELQTDYLDLVLIHWPNDAIPMAETFAGLQALKDAGVIRQFGVSNFTVGRLARALAVTDGIIANQVEFHPSLYQQALLEYCQSRAIVVTAYSPTAKGADLHLPIVQAMAAKYRQTPAQVVLNWLIGKGIVAIPNSGDAAHIADNFGTLEWELAAEDVAAIDAANANNRGTRPAFAEFET